MSAWVFLYIYLVGAVLVALRLAWHIRYRLDKYDHQFGDVRGTFWLDVVFWPLWLAFNPGGLIHPVFPAERWHGGRAEAEREIDRLEANPPPCSAFVRYAPKHDEHGACDSEFVFDAAELLAVMEQRLAELPPKQQGRFPGIANWLRQRDATRLDPVDAPAAWDDWFLKIATGMMNRGLGQVRCGQCNAIIPQERITLDHEPKGLKGSGWRYSIWCCPQGHKLLTKDAIHLYMGGAR